MDKPPIFASVLRAYSDTSRVILTMPASIFVVVMVGLGDTLVNEAFDLSSSGGGQPGKILLIRLALGVAEAILLTPVVIAIHRFLILNEVTRGYALDVNDPHLQVVAGWMVVIFLLTEFPVTVAGAFGLSEGPAAALAILMLISVFAVMAWTMLLLPAAAIDAPGTTFQNALADMSGSFWRAFAILMLILLPILAISAALSAPLEETSKITAAIWSLAGFYCGLLWTSAASRLFQALAVRLKAPVS